MDRFKTHIDELDQLQDQITDIQVMSSYKTSNKIQLTKNNNLFITHSFSENLRRDGVINQRYQSCLLFGSIFDYYYLTRLLKTQDYGLFRKKGSNKPIMLFKILSAKRIYKKCTFSSRFRKGNKCYS